MAGAGFHDFSAGAVLTADQLDTFLQHQVCMVFASAAARDAALVAVKSEGMLAYLLDVNCMTVYTGSAWSTAGPVHGPWTPYTPAWTSTGGTPPAIGNGVLEGEYQRIGRTVHFRARIFMGSTTTFGAGGNQWRLTVPFASGAAIWEQMAVTGYKVAAGGVTSDGRSYVATNTSYVQLALNDTTGAWTTNNWVAINGTYECAADA